MIAAWRKLDNWFFGHGSPVTLGLFRAIFSGLVFVNLSFILIFFDDWYSQRGFVPTVLGETALPKYSDFFGIMVPRLNIYGGLTSDSLTLTFYLLTMAAALLTSLGLWTRVSSILFAVGLVSLHHRNPLILHGGDTLMRVCVLYLAIAPSGSAVSLDRWRARKRGLAPEIPPLISLWPQRLLQIQTAILYFTTFWHKMGGLYWRTGEATWYPLHLNEFDRFPLPEFTNADLFIRITSWGTLVVQLSMATLVFAKPLRKWVLLGGIGLHAFIDLAFNIPLFSYLMVTMYLSFYDGTEIVAWWHRIRARWYERSVGKTGESSIQQT